MRTSSSVAPRSALEHAPARDRRARARAARSRCAARTNAGRWRAITSGSSISPSAATWPERDRAVALVDAVLAKRGAQPLPLRGVGREQQRTRRVDVEPVHDAAAQPALADPLDLRVARRHRAEQRSALAGDERVHGHARGLVGHEPAGPVREHAERRVGLVRDAVRVGARRGGHLDALARAEREALVALGDRPPADPHRAAREQAPRAAAREREPLGEEDVEAAPGLGRRPLRATRSAASPSIAQRAVRR